jgi:glycosyltransferase involved in cell wall biosynthesis
VKKILFIANNNIGNGQSGGDTIFLELIKHWQDKLNIAVFASQETKNLLTRYQLSQITTFITDTENHHSSPTVINLIFHNFRRLFKGTVCFVKNYKKISKFDYCYTVSDFYPDFFFGLLYKLIKPKGIWISGHYLFMPLPNSPNSPYKNYLIKGWFYYLTQQLTHYLGKKYADIIYVTSLPDVSRFPKKKTVIIRGGVDTAQADLWLKSNKKHRKIYDAVFQGRLHPQKGVLELIDIWKLVVKKIPSAQLAIIGNGQLESQLENKIKKYKLNQNITLLGFQTGQDKYQTFKQSKIVVHPAIYDSGGMAAAEAMAWGLPGVSFDLEALKTYYPKGMIKTPINDFKAFSENIYQLLNDKNLYLKTSTEALDLINSSWVWKKQANNIYQSTF